MRLWFAPTPTRAPDLDAVASAATHEGGHAVALREHNIPVTRVEIDEHGGGFTDYPDRHKPRTPVEYRDHAVIALAGQEAQIAWLERLYDYSPGEALARTSPGSADDIEQSSRYAAAAGISDPEARQAARDLVALYHREIEEAARELRGRTHVWAPQPLERTTLGFAPLVWETPLASESQSVVTPAPLEVPDTRLTPTALDLGPLRRPWESALDRWVPASQRDPILEPPTAGPVEVPERRLAPISDPAVVTVPEPVRAPAAHRVAEPEITQSHPGVAPQWDVPTRIRPEEAPTLMREATRARPGTPSAEQLAQGWVRTLRDPHSRQAYATFDDGSGAHCANGHLIEIDGVRHDDYTRPGEAPYRILCDRYGQDFMDSVQCLNDHERWSLPRIANYVERHTGVRVPAEAPHRDYAEVFAPEQHRRPEVAPAERLAREWVADLRDPSSRQAYGVYDDGRGGHCTVGQLQETGGGEQEGFKSDPHSPYSIVRDRLGQTFMDDVEHHNDTHRWSFPKLARHIERQLDDKMLVA